MHRSAYRRVALLGYPAVVAYTNAIKHEMQKKKAIKRREHREREKQELMQ